MPRGRVGGRIWELCPQLCSQNPNSDPGLGTGTSMGVTNSRFPETSARRRRSEVWVLGQGRRRGDFNSTADALNPGQHCQGHSISGPRCLLFSRLTVKERSTNGTSVPFESSVLPPSKQVSSPHWWPCLGRGRKHTNNMADCFLAPHLPAQPRPCPANSSQAYEAHRGLRGGVLMALKPRTGPRPHSRVIGPE